MADISPHLLLPFILAAQAQKHVTHPVQTRGRCDAWPFLGLVWRQRRAEHV